MMLNKGRSIFKCNLEGWETYKINTIMKEQADKKQDTKSTDSTMLSRIFQKRLKTIEGNMKK